MNPTPNPRTRRWSWKRTLWVLAALACLAVVGLIFLPQLLPDAALQRQVEAAISERLGRPVSVGAAWFRWGEGLTVTGLRIAQGGEAGDAPLATIRRLNVQIDPLDAARHLAGDALPIHRLRLEGLELWLILGKDGRLNVEDLAGAENPPRIRSTQVADSVVHFENRRVGQSLTLRGVSASVGELASTGQGYFSLSAELPEAGRSAAGARPGRFTVTASLNRLDLTFQEPIVGSLKAEWADVVWPQVLAVAEADPALVDLLTRTSGRMSATFGRGAWAAEGAIEAADLTFSRPAEPGAAPPAEATITQAILGFQLRQAAGSKPLEVTLVKFSAPGIDMKMTGTVRLEQGVRSLTDRAPDPLAAPTPPVASAEVAAPPAPTTKPPAQAGPWTIKEADLRGVGGITWVPLCQSVPRLKAFAEQFERLSGGAGVAFHLVAGPDGPHLNGSVDFSDTLVRWRGVVEKEIRQTLRLDAEAAWPRGSSWFDVARLELTTDAGHAGVTGRVPLALFWRSGAAPGAAPAEEDLGRRLAGARLEAHADIKRTETLLALVPALRTALAPMEADGPLELQLTCVPAESAARPPAGPPPPAWTVKLHGDLTGLNLRPPPTPDRNPALGPHKPAGKRATLDAVLELAPEARAVDLQGLKITFDKAALVWNGAARITWPREEPAEPFGRFEGTLAATAMESAGALLAPQRFPPDAAPVSGEVAFEVRADLAHGRFQGRAKANLERMAIRAKDYLVKPEGQPATLVLTTLWQPGTPHHVEAEAQIELPRVLRLTALGRGDVSLQRLEPAAPAGPPPAAGAPPAPPPEKAGALRLTLSQTTTLELRAEVADLGKAVDLSPALKQSLQGYRTEGGATADVTLSVRQDSLLVGGGVDLTDAALDLGPYLNKPCGRPLKAALTATLSAPAPQTLEVRLARFEAQIADSTAKAGGWVRLAEPALRSTLTDGTRAAVILEEADLKVQADWRHHADLRKTLPWLEPMYSRCGMEGLTALTLAFAGTPTKGKVLLDADATACRILNAETLLKPAGTPATLRMEVRYGETPGQMILDRMAVQLADATATADGRFLFDDPRLTLLAPPTAWSFHIQSRVPDAAILASLFPARLADLKPAGAVTIDLRAGADPKAAEVESCQLTFNKARMEWLGRTFLLDGPVVYDRQRLATEGLNLVAGGSDVTLVAYIAHPNDDPTGSVFVRGKRLDLKELLGLIQQTTEYLSTQVAAAPPVKKAAAPAAKPNGKAPAPLSPLSDKALSDRLVRHGQHLLAAARMSVEVELDRVTLVIPDWNTTYDLMGLKAAGRLAEQRFVMPRLACTLNKGTIDGELVVDFRDDVPVASIAYDARDLQMNENLKPFINSTFPGMEVFGTLSTRATITQRLAAKALPVGRGETVLTDGLLRGKGAPDYISNVLPGLKLTEYRFRRMSNVFENKASGDADNRMVFNGKAYDIYIFGVTHPDGRTDYQLGVDLLVSLGSKVISRTLDQGKLPLMFYTGRIAGEGWAEGPDVRYVLPHEFAYDVFVRQNLLLQLIKSIGEKPPKIEKPPVVPDVKPRRVGAGAVTPAS